MVHKYLAPLLLESCAYPCLDMIAHAFTESMINIMISYDSFPGPADLRIPLSLVTRSELLHSIAIFDLTPHLKHIRRKSDSTNSDRANQPYLRDLLRHTSLFYHEHFSELELHCCELEYHYGTMRMKNGNC